MTSSPFATVRVLEALSRPEKMPDGELVELAPGGATLGDLGLPDDGFVEVNGEPRGRVPDALGTPVAPGDEVVVARMPAGGADDAIKQYLRNLGDFYRRLLDPVGVGQKTLDLFRPPDARRPNRDANQVYNWSGIGSTYNAAGLPIPRLYGLMKVGLLVVAQDVYVRETVDGPESVLRILGIVSAGEIDGFDQYESDQDDLTGDAIPESLRLNNIPARDLEGIRVWLRTGRLGQEPVPGFDVLRTVFDYGVELNQGAGTGADPVVTDWATYVRTYTMDANTEADRLRLTFRFPIGLGDASGGSLKKEKVQIQVRIRRVDLATGSPLSAYAQLPDFEFNEKIVQSFSRQIEFDLFDPDTYAPPVVGGALQIEAGGQSFGGLEDSNFLGTGWASGSSPLDWTFWQVQRLDATRAINPLFAWGSWDGDEATPAVRGIVLWARQVSGNVSELVLWAGDDDTTSVGTVEIVGGEITEDEWFSVAVVYDRVDTGTLQPRIDLYLDGGLVGSVFLPNPLKMDASDNAGLPGGILGPKWGVRPETPVPGGDAQFATVTLDESAFFTVAKSGGEVGVLHNAGAWLTQVGAADLLWVIPHDTFDFSPVTHAGNAPAGGGLPIPFARWDNQGGIPAPSFLPAPGGAVATDPGNPTERGRYEIQVQRIDADLPGTLKYDTIEWENTIVELDERIGYSGCAVVALEVPASGQLSNSRPNVTVNARGLKVNVWDGVSESAPAFSKVYSQVPAWQVLDILTATPGGLGQFHKLNDGIRLADFADWADWTGQLVYDMRGKVVIDSLALQSTPPNTEIVLQTSSPIPSHWEVGSTVKIAGMPAAWPCNGMDVVINSIVEVAAPVYNVICAYPGGGPKNLNPEPSRIGEAAGSWTWVGTAGTIDTENAFDVEPASKPAGFQEMDVLTLPNNTSREIACPGVVSGAMYQLSVDCRVMDGGGPFQIRLRMGTGQYLQTVPDDGQTHRVIGYVMAGGGAPTDMQVGNQDGSSRQIAVGCAFAAPMEDDVVLPYDPGFPYTFLSASNLLTNPDMSDESDWTLGGANPLGVERLASNVEPLPDGIPGFASKFKMNEGGNYIETLTAFSGSIGSADTVYGSVYAKPVVTRSITNLLALTLNAAGGAVDTGTSVFGEWDKAASIRVAGSNTERHRVTQTGIGGQARTWLLGGPFIAVSTTALPYDDGTLGECYGTEPRIPTNVYFGDRGYGAWDAVRLLFSAGRAAPYRLGGEIGATVDRPRDSVFLFGPWNIRSSTFTRNAVNPRELNNSLFAEIQAEDLDYARDPVVVDAESLEDGDVSSTATIRRGSLDLRGITRRSVAVRELGHRIEKAQAAVERVSFEVGREALGCIPGSVFSLTHPSAMWGVGAKVNSGGSVTKLTSDRELILNSYNMLAWARDIRQGPWRVIASATADEPVVTDVTGTVDPPAGLPPDTPVFQIDYTGTGASARRLEQQIANRQGGGHMGFVYARTVSGTWPGGAAGFQLQITYATGAAGGSTQPELTTSWQRIALGPVDLSGVTVETDPEIQFRMNQPATDNGNARSIYVCCPRMIQLGFDDGKDAVGAELTGGFERNYLGWRRASDGEVFFRPMDPFFLSGRVPQGGLLWVTEDFPGAPQPGDGWMVGPLSQLTRFLCTGSKLLPNGNRQIDGVSYYDGFRDPATYETLEIQVAPTAAQQQAQAQSQDAALPGQVEFLGVQEDLIYDPDSGRRERSLAVSWTLDRDTADLVDKVLVWARTDEGSGSLSATRMDLVATVERGVPAARIPQETLPLRRGERVEVAVQPVSRTGIRRPVRFCTRKALTVEGYWPSPPKVAAGRVVLQGDRVTYEVDVPADGVRGMGVELVRGGVFIHQEIGRLSPGGRTLGPTDDWVSLPTSANGIGNPRLLARVVTDDNDRGQFVEVPSTLDTSQIPAATAEDSVEDDWVGNGTLDTGLQATLRPDASGITYLEFTGASGDTTLYYTVDAVDLGRRQRWHLSLGLEGRQEHPIIVDDVDEDFPPFDSPRGERWTLEGPLDRADPLYDTVEVVPEIRYTTASGDPTGESWRDARSGVYDMRSFQLRLRITRPDTTWNVQVDRFAYSARRWDRGLRNEEVTT